MNERRGRERGIRRAALLAAVAVAWALAGCGGEERYASFTRPDGAYEVVVFRTSASGGRMPGQAGDSPGVVRLYDRRGRLLEEAPVEMVQLVEEVDWADGRARIKLVADWELPE